MLVMLRNRSRRATSKQALMRADNDSQSSTPTLAAQSNTKPMTSFLVSPRFKAFTFKGLPAEAENTMSRTSILNHSKPFSPFKNPIWCEEAPLKSPRGFLVENKHSWEKQDSKGIGVALIDDTASGEPSEENSSTSISISKASNRVVLSGAKLRVQIPPQPNCTLTPVGSPILNPQLSTGPSNSANQTNDSPQIFAGFLSMSEMELSEDYTCVISHGPDPTTTHIFGNCIVDKCCFVSGKSNPSRKDFLGFCHTCKKKLEQKNDVYIYRGEKAFCSRECRYQEMLLDGVENQEFGDD